MVGFVAGLEPMQNSWPHATIKEPQDKKDNLKNSLVETATPKVGSPPVVLDAHPKSPPHVVAVDEDPLHSGNR